jgi:plasmid stability protein
VPALALLDGMPQACHCHALANLQVKNVPDELNKRLHRYAEQQGRSIRDVVLEAVRRELDRRMFTERLRRRSTVKLKTSPAELLAAERREREE